MVEIGDLERSIAEFSLRANQEADEADDIEMRTDIIHDLIYAEDSEERVRGRAKVNARLRTFLTSIVVRPGPQLTFHFKPEYEHVDRHMSSIYGSGASIICDERTG